MTVTDDTITDDSPDYLHVVITDPDTGRLIDFQIIALPLTIDATLRALSNLHERHVRRCDADACCVEHLDGAIEPAEDRDAIRRRRRQEIIERLAPIEDLWTDVSPYRPEGHGDKRGERS